MYESQLMRFDGYKLVYTTDGSLTHSHYLTVDTSEKVLYLANAAPDENKTIEDLLYQADLLYSSRGTDPDYQDQYHNS